MKQVLDIPFSQSVQVIAKCRNKKAQCENKTIGIDCFAWKPVCEKVSRYDGKRLLIKNVQCYNKFSHVKEEFDYGKENCKRP